MANLERIVITNTPYKTIYDIGELFEVNGLSAIGIYDDETTQVLTISESDIAGFNSNVVGLNTLIITKELITTELILSIIDSTNLPVDIELGQKINVLFNQLLRPPTPTLGIVSLGKSYIAGVGTLDNRGNSIVDGQYEDTTLYVSVSTTDPTYLEIDLGGVAELEQVKVWHYYLDERTYHDTKTEVSEDGITWVTVFDSAVDGEYAETSAGKTHTFAPINVRYIRDWLHGSTSNTGNHWVEIDAYGSLSVIIREAFTITGKHQRYINGPVDDVEYEISSVELTDLGILINFEYLKKFRDTHENITITYDSVIGNIQGYGGNVESFEVEFSPRFLEKFLNPVVHETISAESAITYTLNDVGYTDLLNGDVDNITASAEITFIFQEASVVNP